MGTASKIFTALSAGAPCLLAYPGIFSGLSNDGKQSPALIFTLHAFQQHGCVSNFAIFENTSATKAFHEEPTLSMPFYQGVDFCFHPTFTVL
jgi:hypothetical protein